MARPIITLTTDFGLRDPYVAEMKAVILNICSEATIVDVSHKIEKFNIRMAAFMLACAAPYFPKGTIHVAVVDPGVGTKRKPVLIQTRNAIYIGPDNGILILATKNERIVQMREITNKKLMMPQISNTFHGRDIFAPTAAHLAKGTKVTQAGKQIHKTVRPSFANVSKAKGKLVGEAIHVDDFGNIVTNFGESELRSAKTHDVAVIEVQGLKLDLGISNNYEETQKHKIIGIIGSHGFLEISMNQASAAKHLNIKAGDKITLCLAWGNEQG